MALLGIPEPHRVGLAKLRRLSDENIEAIISALQHQTVTATSGKDVMAAITPRLSKVPADDIEKISDTLFSLYFVQADADVSRTKFASDVSGALRDSGEEFTEEEFSRFTDRMAKLLSIDLLSVASKALSLESDHENTLYEAKILTDVRPVFGTSVDNPPAGFIITHTLKIGYHDAGSDHRDFYVALDEDDLTTLKSKIERAQKKANSIMSLMSKTGIRNLLLNREKKS